MTFSEKMYALRKKSGLSQEQLAEQLNVSRQAISKWELGQSMPESDKIVAISSYFNVSLDYLMKETEETNDNNDRPANDVRQPAARKSGILQWLSGIIFCIVGIVSLILWGLLTILNTAFSKQLSASSIVRLDGNGIFLTVCIAAMIVGAVLLLNAASKK